MAVSRRHFILAAGGAGLALIATSSIFSVTRTPVKAISPWHEISNLLECEDPRLSVFRHAILAPNPHNRQPWLIRLIGQNQALLSCDLDRRLPITDPFDRQILIGFGCFLELARIAAAELGIRMEITLFPEGEPGERLDKRPIASLQFVSEPSITKEPLYAFIGSRRSNKKPFDTSQPVESRFIEALGSHPSPSVKVAASNNGNLIENLRVLTWDAWKIELETERAWLESVELMRIGKTEIESKPDGISIGGTVVEVLSMAGKITREEMAKKGSNSYNASIDRYRPTMLSGMAYGWIVTDGNSRHDQIATGKAYVRMNLMATCIGLGFHPVSQALQEYPEMTTMYDRVSTALGARRDQRVQMLIRLGYGEVIDQAPRWPLASRLI